jgi:hypothetical protein
MKTLYASALVLFMTLSFAVNTTSAQEKENKIIATFKSITEQGFYKFTDDKNVDYLFYDVAEDVEIALDDESYLDKTFSITWTTKEIDELDDEGEETGDKITVKTILTIKEEK